ncbi:MAG: PCYCGC motif-containing (lipo)protein [Vicinamibacterales bacterium]|nr:PCYCGC motif-containing (lipo)protein [Vicinamibacterales bacterium]MDP7480150.1 PCYCGC motif-containing (lipo)protein [Vicinamibacterales bacterium]MDP7690927.1 PCYCGC motif-containing (lipo)protein [Vicinamibacterales bacterium]HJN46783.1 PCYCGC motif-containing (lipo)protein [Vicinamibacterales bacterium]
MGSKKNRRHARPAPPVQEPSKSTPWPIIAIAVVAVAAGGIFVASRSSDPAPSPDATGSMSQASTSTPASAPGAASLAASAVSDTPFTPEGPNDLPMPPLPYVSQMTGSPELVKEAYVFAAQNPGVLEYVPCYCGCENDGHRSNVDCFVGSRASNGAVESWDTHGMT